MEAYEGDVYYGWTEYVTYGGLPLTVTMKTEEQKINHLSRFFEETYIKEIVERNRIEKFDGKQFGIVTRIYTLQRSIYMKNNKEDPDDYLEGLLDDMLMDLEKQYVILLLYENQLKNVPIYGSIGAM